MIKLYPSSAAFMQEDTVITGYDSGCLRKILLTSKNVRGQIPTVYMEVGAVHENQYEALLKSDPTVSRFLRELPIKQPVPGFETVMYSGRMDFVVEEILKRTEGVTFAPMKTREVITETKGSISKTTRREVIRKGNVKVNQLAQLVSYMIARQSPYGRLVCAYYERHPETLQLVKCEERMFKIFIDDEGAVLIDGMPSGFTVEDQINHRKAAAKVLVEDRVGERPDGWTDIYKGPCCRCIHKDTCSRFDAGHVKDTEEFVALARVDLDIAVINKKPEPEANWLKIKKPTAPKKAKAKQEKAK